MKQFIISYDSPYSVERMQTTIQAYTKEGALDEFYTNDDTATGVVIDEVK